jgi:hypothetical protein
MLLKFDARLYDRAAVDKAVEAFAESAKIQIKEQNGVIGVELKGGDVDAEFAAEFSNYVLGGMSR